MNHCEKVVRSEIRWILAGLTLIVYWRVSLYGFINYDDGLFVAQNPHVYSGITFANLKWAFTSLNGDASTYHPLTWLTHQMDCQLFGLRPGPQHLTNLTFHVVNTELLFTLLYGLTGRVWRSAAVAALFALHPLHIETVAWISERKSLVCTFFWFLTILAYVHYVQKETLLHYLLVLGLFAAALLSKAIAVSLPFTLLLIDYWPLGRFLFRTNQFTQDTKSGVELVRVPSKCLRPVALVGEITGRSLVAFAGIRQFPCSRLLLEKVPLMLLSLMCSCITIVAQVNLGATSTLEQVPICDRLKNLVIACVLYLRKMLLPIDLAPIYPLRQDWAWWQCGLCTAILGSISIAMVYQAREKSYRIFGWLWYLITLLPTLGIVQVGKQGMADRYSYVSLIGIFIVIVWELVERLDGRCNAVGLVTTGISSIIVYLVLSCSIVRCWQSSVTLFEHAIHVAPSNYIAQAQLGLGLLERGEFKDAESHLRESLRLHPRQGGTEMWLGECVFREGHCEAAFEHYSLALRLLRNNPVVYDKLGELFVKAEDPRFYNPRKALKEEQLACELTHYRNCGLLQRLALMYAENGLFKEALDIAKMAQPVCVAPQEREKVAELISRIQLMDKLPTNMQARPAERNH